MRKNLLHINLYFLLVCFAALFSVAQSQTSINPAPSKNQTKFYGAYRFSPNRTISVSEWTDGSTLMLTDYKTGKLRALYLSSGNTYFAGAGIMLRQPVEFKVTFVENAKGEVTKLRWQPEGEPETIAEKIAFREEQVSFKNKDVTFSGTLIVPPNKEIYPVVIIVPGAFPTSRNLLRVWAHNFASRGIAALVYDARGSGSSTGAVGAGSFDDFASDVLAAIQLLKTRKNINSAQIGLFGFSNSAWTITLAASRSKDVAFIIPQVLSGVPPWQQETYRVESQLRTDGFSDDVIRQAVAFMKLKFEVARTGENWETLQSEMNKYQNEKWFPFTNPPRALERLRQTWETQFSYDPVPAFEQINCPILAIWAGRDRLVPTEMSIPIFEKALKKAGNKDYTFLVFPTANHSLMQVETGASGEFMRMDGFAPAYWETMANWVLKIVKK